MIRTLGRYSGFLAASVLVAVFLSFAAPIGGPPAHALLTDTDGDGFIDTTEVVVGSDPNNPQSMPEDWPLGYPAAGDVCKDGTDNDLDGTTDGLDAGCNNSDFDYFSDAIEVAFGTDPEDDGVYPEDYRLDVAFTAIGFTFAVTCDNDYDDDGDGAADSADSGCDVINSDSDPFDDRTEKLFGSDLNDSSSRPEHESVNPGSCSDGADNDRDGAVDSADVACRQPTNDAFVDARRITSIPFEDRIKLTGASAEVGELQAECAGNPDDAATVWYVYTPPADTALAAHTTGTTFSTRAVVWIRDGDEFVDVACARTSSPSQGARASFQATRGETYYIQVIGFPREEEPADLHFALEEAELPANDNFASATQITSLPFEETIHALDATSELDEPDGDCYEGRPYSTVWYGYTPQETGKVIVSTVGSQSFALTSIWTESPFGFSEIACAEGREALEVESGRTYYFQVFRTSAGLWPQFHFSLDAAIPPANDDFADATQVSSLPFEDTVDFITATREAGEPESTCGFNGLDGTTWYRITSQATGHLAVTVRGPEDDFFPGDVAAYQGASLSTLTEVACGSTFNDPAGVILSVEAGQTYLVQVAASTFEDALLSVQFDLLTVPACAPAEFTLQDVPNDHFVFGRDEDIINATSISGGDDGANYCVRVQFDRPLPPAPGFDEDAASASIGFDTDSDTSTGFSGVAFPCGSGLVGESAALGSEVSARIEFDGRVIVPLRTLGDAAAGADGSGDPVFGFVRWGAASLHFVVPMSVLGDDDFLFAMSINGLASVDCLPNGGGIHSPDPNTMFGDVNCDDTVNSVDSALVLQRVAQVLLQESLCGYLGDVDYRDGLTPIDAVLILQHSSGLLQQFPAER